MSIANKYNKVALFEFSIPKEFGYKSLSDLFETFGKETQYTIRAVYMNKKSRFGESPVVATDDCLVNLPQHLTETCKSMLQDVDFIKAVNEGKVGFTIYPYETKGNANNEVFYSVNWIDM